MAALTFLPLDLKGNKPSNRIIGERRTLVQVPNKPHRVLLPRMGAFYKNKDLVLQANGQVLKHGRDYTTTYLYSALSKLASLPIYAFIVVTNPDIPDTVTLDYHAVGGPFGLDISELALLLEALDDRNFKVSYEDIINKPKAFNPTEHEDEYWQLYGAENTLTVINRVAKLAAQKDVSIQASLEDYTDHYHALAVNRLRQEEELFIEHVNDKNNPHQDTQTTVGLGLLNNWSMADLTQHLDPTLWTKYAHPEGGLHAITQGPVKELNLHIADKNNPHGVTAATVNAYTTEEQNTLLAQRLDKLSPAYNSTRIFGLTPAEFKVYVNNNLPANAITQGLFNSARLGSGTASTSTFLTGEGRWRTIRELVDIYDANAVRKQTVVIRTSQATTTAAAINYANVNFGNVNVYPVGSKAIFHAINRPSSDVGTQYEVKFLVRNSSGWASFIP